MKLTLSPEMVQRFPEYTMYTIVAKGIVNDSVPDELAALLAGAAAQVRATLSAESYLAHPRLASWRAAFARFGADPDVYPPSVQHLAELALAGGEIASSSPVVALLNYISLKYLVPCGADDLGRVTGDFGVRLAQGDEIYVPIGGSEVEPVERGEVIYADQRKVMARRWVWRQGEHTKVTPQTTDVTINVDILPPATRAEGEAAIRELMELLAKFCGGEISYNVLDAAHREETIAPPAPRAEPESIYDLLEMRGYIRRSSDREGVRKLLRQPTTIYQGFDPTGDSLHIGHLLSLMVFRYLQEAGHKMLFLSGGGTAQVGDPTGKTKSRRVMTNDEIEHNMAAIRAQVQGIGLADFDHDLPGRPKAEMVNNADWLNMPMFDYLREVALYFSVNRMVKMETFEQRLNEQGHLSLFEFMYPTMQGYDFYHLYTTRGCRLQLGGDDQWTNILSGADLISRRLNETAYAMTFSLLLDASGQKMGKTAEGEAIWLNAQRTTPFAFYQYWVNSADTELRRLFRLFTFLPLDEIDQIVAGDPRAAQHRLAFEVTKVVHGEEAARTAQADARKAFGGAGGLPEDVPTLAATVAQLEAGLPLVDVIASAPDVTSKGEARRLVQQGAVRVNDGKAGEIGRLLTLKDVVEVDGQRAVLVRYRKQSFIKVVVA